MSIIENYLHGLLKLEFNPEQLNYYQWILDNGKHYTEHSGQYEEYEILVNLAEPKNCYVNSLLSSIKKPELRYIEGFYVINLLALAVGHGFNVDKDDKILDFTTKRNNIKVIERFGVELPNTHLDDFLNSDANGVISYMQYYYRRKFNLKLP